MKITKRITADDVTEIMNKADKCRVLAELLEIENADKDWGLSQTLSMMKELLEPVVADLIELSEQMDNQAVEAKLALQKVA